ncbi:MAG: penicillin-binding protein 2 [Dictyoglomus sp.]|nr:penicillin-binding protein 2 [Dictyoglomus sp.]MCX7942364.1 penicillin-binding protein 2 [Dictyoglomaceae bacterium]MDW8188432.1 penicillin-binding protein 2 [Dictyoglomus sp.]
MINYKRLKIFVISWLSALVFVEIFLFKIQFRPMLLGYEKNTSIKRGIIYDRKGEELVFNVYRKSLAINPLNISKKERDKIIEGLSRDLSLSKDTLRNKLAQNTNFIWIKRILSPYEVNKIKKYLSNDKIFLVEEPYRAYPLSLATSPLLGIVGVDNQGLYGLEAILDPWLREGKNVYLTLDKELQVICANYLKKGIENYKAKGGMIGIIDSNTGEILALAIMPSFNIEEESLWDIIENFQNFYPLNSIYEPGSVFKIITAVIALEENLVDPLEKVECKGEEEIDGHIIRCVKNHGKVNLERAIVESCNIYFYKLSKGISPSIWSKYIRLFNLDLPIPGDVILNPRDFLISNFKESSFTRGTIGFGQGIALSPIKLLWSLSALANYGWLNELHLIKRIEDLEGKIVFKNSPVRLSKIISEKTCENLLNYLQKVVKEGTANNLNLDGYKIAGKTGTAQVSKENGYENEILNHFFLGYLFLPENTYTIIVMLQEPKIGKYARETAVPIFGEIIKRLVIYGRTIN